VLWRAVFLGALLGGLLAATAACGENGAPGAGAPEPRATETSPTPADSPSAETSPPLSQVPPPTLSRPLSPPEHPSDLVKLKPVTARGRVVRGIEPGCLELIADKGRYTLIGELAQDLAPEDRVEIVGMPAPALRSVCAGEVLRVREIRRLSSNQ
jgi:hypothetical protein